MESDFMATRCPLSPLQVGMLLKSLDPANREIYIIQTVFEWQQVIRVADFEKAWRRVAASHEILRSTFHWRRSPNPYQEIHPEPCVQLEVIDENAWEPDEKKSALKTFLNRDLKRSFELSDAPPWRISVLSFKDGSRTAVWTFHHLLLDGRSHVSILQELLSIYDSLAEDVQLSTEGEIAQRSHVRWLESQDFSVSKTYWTSYLNADKLPTELPRPMAGTKAAGHATYYLRLGSELTRRMHLFAKEEAVSAGNIVQTAWAFILGWLANEADVTFGAVRACRKSGLPGGDRIVGVVINTLPLRVRWEPESTFRQVVRQVAADWRNFRECEHTPIQEIARWTGLHASREMFTTAVSFSSEYFEHAVLRNSPDKDQRHLWLQQTTPYCAVDASLDGSELQLSISLPVNLVLPSIAENLPAYLRNTIRAIVETPESAVRDLCPLDTEERRAIVLDLNSHWEPAPLAVNWLGRIDAHALQGVDRTAVYSPNGSLSWGELEQLSNQTARFLKTRGIEQNDLVAVFVPRSAEFVWTCFGIMKSGAAFLPLDPEWPAERIGTILDGARVKGVLSSQALTGHLTSRPEKVWIAYNEIATYSGAPLSTPELTPDQLAYVIYTSGSTGVPKGVEITHRGLENLINDTISEFTLTAADQGTFLSNTAFDASVAEIWPVLTAGGTIHIPDSCLLTDPRGLLAWLEQSKISFCFLSTATAEVITQLCGTERLSLRYLLTGGDRLRVVPDRELSFQLVNEYGPTESTVIATRYNLHTQVDAHRNIPIGRPIMGTRAYVASCSWQLVPRGVAGELLLGGSSLAKGYRNEPELTAAKFIANWIPEEPGSALYRTGDLVRWDSDGNLEFLGRIDAQVKLRGFRIELGDIETCLLKHDSVAETVVILYGEATPRLVAFLVLRDGADRQDLSRNLAAFLSRFLPDYMVPAAFVEMAALPVNSSGKYDRKLLSKATPEGEQARAAAPVEPLSLTERQIIEIWKQTLGLSSVQATDRFLELGGTSVSIIQLLCAVELAFGRTISAADILKDPTPIDLARVIDNSGTNPEAVPTPLSVVHLKGSGPETPILVVPGAGGGVHWFRELATTLDGARSLVGLELLGLSEETQRNFTVAGAAEELAGVAKGIEKAEPYILCGYSGGGLIALEIASRLRKQGRNVSAVILLETHPPEQIASGGLSRVTRWVQGWLSLPYGQRRDVLISRLRWCMDVLDGHERQSPNVSAALPQSLKDMKARHMHAFLSHCLSPYEGRVLVVSAQDRPISARTDPRSEWAGILTGEVSHLQVPGDHYSILSGKNAEFIGQFLTRVLNFNSLGQEETAKQELGPIHAQSAK